MDTTLLLDGLIRATPDSFELEAEQIPKEWVLSGSPTSRSKTLKRSADWTSTIVVWECTAGTFQWHYGVDESILIVSGEAILLGANGEETRFGPGDVAYFPAGSCCTWRVEESVRKIAVLRETMWPIFGLTLKVCKKLMRMLGLSAKSPL
jgi:uncharacterized cupin superfamily protein